MLLFIHSFEIVYKSSCCSSSTMGGHSAWRKRVDAGDTAKGSGGAIMRHRPHLGRKGKDLILNRKGHIAGGNPKKKNRKILEYSEQNDRRLELAADFESKRSKNAVLLIVLSLILTSTIGMLARRIFRRERSGRIIWTTRRRPEHNPLS
jgi:hypothetical protein